MIQTIKVVHDIIELWQRPAYRAAAALSLFFLLNITSSLPWVKVLSTQLLWSPPAPPSGVTSWKKRKERKRKRQLGLLSILYTHILYPPWNTDKGARTWMGLPLANRYSRNRISVQCDSNHCHFFSPPNVSAPTSLCNGRKCCLFFAGCVPHLPKTISGYEICDGILRRGGIKCSHAPLGGKRNGGWAQRAGGSLTHPLQCRWQMYRRWKQASSYEAISNI